MELMQVEKVASGLVTSCYAVVAVLSVRNLSFRRSMAPVYFTFGLVSALMSGLYWVAYDLLRPELRMPFAANEFGEMGWFLLLASALNAVFRGRFAAARRETVCAVLFVAASTALWIAWSGEWLQDVMAALSFGYFLCVCVRSMKQSDALSRWEWRLLGGFAAGILALQGLTTFLLPEPWKTFADYAAYAVMFTMLICAMVKLIRTMVRKENPAAQFALAASFLACCISNMYMSEGVFYLAALPFYMVSMPLVYVALRREEAEA